jgi:phosphoesterase RecJ-like protein
MNIDILNEEQLTLLLSIIKEAKHIAVVGHKSPDGDALGASLAMAGYLRAVHGRDVSVVVPDAYPDFLHWLPESHTIIRYDKRKEDVEKIFAEADTIFCMDMNQPSRVDIMESLITESDAKKVVIDHHLAAELNVDQILSYPEMSSTSEIVFRLVWQLGEFEAMDNKWATQIYCGMMTDTGGFTYNSTRPEIFFIISNLLTKGIDKDKIYRKVYNNFSSWAVRLRGYIMAQKLNVFEDLHASYFAISRMDMEEYQFIKGDAEGLVNVPLTIKGLKMSISLREDDRNDNSVWVSIRSVDDFPANEVAERFFNGGGHKNAAGGHLDCSLDEACRIARQAINAYAEQLKK